MSTGSRLGRAWEKHPFEILAAGVIGLEAGVFAAGFLAGRSSAKRSMLRAIMKGVIRGEEEP